MDAELEKKWLAWGLFNYIFLKQNTLFSFKCCHCVPCESEPAFPPQLWDVWQRGAENGGCAEGQPAGSASCACRAAGTQLLPKALTPFRCSVVPIRSFDHFRALKKVSCSVLAHVTTFCVERTFLYSPLQQSCGLQPPLGSRWVPSQCFARHRH